MTNTDDQDETELYYKAQDNIRAFGRIVLTITIGLSLYLAITNLGVILGIIIGLFVGVIVGVIIAGVLGRWIFPDIKK